MPLQNHFAALQTEEERPVTSGEMMELSTATQSAPRVTNNQHNFKKMTDDSRVIVVGNCLLRGMEANLTPSLERCAAYQWLLSGMSPRDYQALYTPLTAIFLCVHQRYSQKQFEEYQEGLQSPRGGS